MALWLSQNKVVRVPFLSLISTSTFLSHKACALTDVSAIYSTSIEDNATMAYLLELHVINLDPKDKHCTLMDFMSYMLLPQSLSLKPTSFNYFSWL